MSRGFFAETYLPKSPVPVQITHFGKPVAQGFVVFLQESWMVETCTGSQEVQQLWQELELKQL